MADDDDDDDGLGFLTTAALLALAAGGVYFLYRTLTAQAAAATPGGAPASSPLSLTSLLTGTAPLGVRNNNPGNIKYNPANNWDGQTGQDANGFAVFSDPTYGLRAMFLTLQSYAGEISPYTIQQIGARWTSGDPSTSQASWVATVSSVSGLSQTQVLDPTDAATMQALVTGIVAAENGQQYAGNYGAQMVQAWQMTA